MKKNFTVLIDTEIQESIRAIAFEHRVSINVLVSQLLENFAKEFKKDESSEKDTASVSYNLHG